MELRYYLAIIRRRWWLVVAIPLLIALLSLAAAATRPSRYGLAVRLLVTRSTLSAKPATATPYVDNEDRVAYDLPAIIGSSPFAEDVVRELAAHGHPLSQAEVEQALHAENDRQLVRISVTAPNPDDAVAIAQASVALIKTNGLRYWGDPHATPENPGINVAVLDPPTQAVLLNRPQAIATEVALRALLGLIAGIGAAFALHYLDGSQPAAGSAIAGVGRRRPPTQAPGDR